MNSFKRYQLRERRNSEIGAAYMYNVAPVVQRSLKLECKACGWAGELPGPDNNCPECKHELQLQEELVRRYYAVRLNRPNAPMLRLQLFEIVENDLKPVWPADSHYGRRATRLPFQVFSTLEGYPAFHFAIERGLEPPIPAIAKALARHFNCRVIVRVLADPLLFAGDAQP